MTTRHTCILAHVSKHDTHDRHTRGSPESIGQTCWYLGCCCIHPVHNSFTNNQIEFVWVSSPKTKRQNNTKQKHIAWVVGYPTRKQQKINSTMGLFRAAAASLILAAVVVAGSGTNSIHHPPSSGEHHHSACYPYGSAPDFCPPQTGSYNTSTGYPTSYSYSGTFPKWFKWGLGTAAYQIEGAYRYVHAIVRPPSWLVG